MYKNTVYALVYDQGIFFIYKLLTFFVLRLNLPIATN